MGGMTRSNLVMVVVVVVGRCNIMLLGDGVKLKDSLDGIEMPMKTCL